MKPFFTLLAAFSVLLVQAAELRIFPADFQKGHYSLNEGNSVPLEFTLTGSGREMAKANARLIIETHENVPVIAIATQHPKCLKLLKIEREGKVNTVTLPPEYLSLVFPTRGWKSGLSVYFRAKPGTAGLQFPVKVSIVGNGRKFIEKKLNFKISDPLPVPAKPLKKLGLLLWRLHSAFLPEEAEYLFDENIAFWKKLCQTPGTTVGIDFNLMPKARGEKLLKNFRHMYALHCSGDTPIIPGSSYGYFDKSFKISRPGVRKMVNSKGEESRQNICPLYLINDPEGVFWDQYIAGGLRDIVRKFPNAEAISWNFEVLADSGVCQTCREDFAKRRKLKKVPSVKDLLPGGALHKEWRYYRSWSRNEILKRFAAVMKRECPNVKFSISTVCLVPGQNWIDNWTGLNVKAMDSYADHFANMFYLSGRDFCDWVSYNLAELKKPQTIVTDPAERDIRWFSRYSPVLVRQNILAAFALGSKSFALFPEDYFDAAYLTMFAETFNAVASAEDAYLRGAVRNELNYQVKNVLDMELSDGKKMQTIQVPELTPWIRVFHHRDGENDYATLLNYSSNRKIILELAIPAWNGSNADVTDLISGTAYTGLTPESIRKGFLAVVPENGAVLLKIGSKEKAKLTLSQTSLKTMLAQEIENAEKFKENFKTVKSQNREISFLLKDSNPVIQLKNGKASLQCNPGQGGIITSFIAPGLGEYLAGKPQFKFFGELAFQEANSSIPAKIPYTVQSLSKDASTVTLAFTVPPDLEAGGNPNPLEMLRIVKEIKLKDYNGSLRIVHRFTNQSKKTMKFGFRVRNITEHYWNPKAAGTRLTLADGSTRPRKGIYTFLKQESPQVTAWLGDAEKTNDLDVKYCWGRLSMQFRFPDFIGLYLWGSETLRTVEPVSDVVILKPGETKSFAMHVDMVWNRKPKAAQH